MEHAQENNLPHQLAFLDNNADIVMACLVVGILILMVMPLPAFILDLLLSLNITCAIIILLVGMYIVHPLELSSFPSILLLATLFRLALNIASTRIILMHGAEGTGAAGKVIQAFGHFVVGGNYLIGIIVFLILVIINFMVITKGAGRIAEVAARFTLDAMPGKQMSIDADLNAGLITEDEARTRRETIAREAEYYGAMDGANKFVRGDAIAGIIITLINIFGGLAIGVMQNGLSFTEAAQNYTLLTVGDGLVSQVPALVISTAAGIIVSRAGSESSLGRDITAQIMFHHRAIAIAAAVLIGFSIVPGMPTLPFLILAAITAAMAYAIYKAAPTAGEAILETEPAGDGDPAVERQETLPPLDILSLEVGYGLIPLVDLEQDGQLLNRIRAIRSQMAEDVGIIVPPVHIQDNMQLQPGEYRILLKGNEIARGELVLNHFLAMDPGDAVGQLDGVSTTEPTYGLPAVWIKEEQRERAIADGFTVVDIATVMTTHTSDIIKRFAHELVGRQEVQGMLDHLKQTYPKVVEELIPNLLPLGGVVKVLQNLLKEQVSIRDLLAILETLADWAPMTKDLDILTEYVRQALSRGIVGTYLGPDGALTAVTLDQRVETAIAEAIQRTDHGSFLAMEPRTVERIVQALSRHIEAFANLNSQPVVLGSAHVRIHFKRMIDRLVPNLAVLSYDEVMNNAQVNTIGVLEIN
ncbi:MAG: flagellar biosynthesis protein FlhA [Desulfobacterales bacterium]|nr:flagellar biosynthesis protein FlhA [Desulfobacterales bacterium]